MLWNRTGGDFDRFFMAGADTDALRTQLAEVTRATELLAAAVASLRDTSSDQVNADGGRIDRLEAQVNALISQVAAVQALAQPESLLSESVGASVTFGGIIVRGPSALRGDAVIAGSSSTLSFFEGTGTTKQTPTFTNANGDIGGLAISNPPTQAEVQALRDACETLADGTRNVRAALQAYKLIG
jgi:hypothetical protein